MRPWCGSVFAKVSVQLILKSKTFSYKCPQMFVIQIIIFVSVVLISKHIIGWQHVKKTGWVRCNADRNFARKSSTDLQFSRIGSFNWKPVKWNESNRDGFNYSACIWNTLSGNGGNSQRERDKLDDLHYTTTTNNWVSTPRRRNVCFCHNTLCLKKRATLLWRQFCQILTDFQFFHCWKVC